MEIVWKTDYIWTWLQKANRPVGDMGRGIVHLWMQTISFANKKKLYRQIIISNGCSYPYLVASLITCSHIYLLVCTWKKKHTKKQNSYYYYFMLCIIRIWVALIKASVHPSVNLGICCRQGLVGGFFRCCLFVVIVLFVF